MSYTRVQASPSDSPFNGFDRHIMSYIQEPVNVQFVPGEHHGLRNGFKVTSLFDTDSATWIYYTNGTPRHGNYERQEFMMLDAAKRFESVEILHWVAAFAAERCGVGLGSTLKIGRPWYPDSGLYSSARFGSLPLPYDHGVICI